MKNYGDPVWQQLFLSQPWGKYPSEEAVRFFFHSKKQLQKTHPEVLDIGCGKGAVSWFMQREGAQVTAIDGSPAGLENVPILAASFGVTRKITTVSGDITRPLDFLPQHSFDIAIDHYSLYANPKSLIPDAYSQIRELLRPDSRFLTCIFGPQTEGLDSGIQIEAGTVTQLQSGPLAQRGPVTIFSAEELQQLLINCSFEVEYTESIIHNSRHGRIEKIICCVKPSGDGR